jgi:hypothetical protein
MGEGMSFIIACDSRELAAIIETMVIGELVASHANLAGYRRVT